MMKPEGNGEKADALRSAEESVTESLFFRRPA